MELISQIISKVGIAAFGVAVIILVVFLFWVAKMMFKYRKDFKNIIDAQVEKENKKKELNKTVEDSRTKIKTLQEMFDNMKGSINDIEKEINQIKDNRIHDREQSFEIQKELTGLIKGINNSNTIKEKQIDSLMAASRELLADKINQKYKYYISINGIPEDEYDEFESLHQASNGVYGNHHGDAKFNYCIENLKVIPVKAKLVSADDKYDEHTIDTLND